MSTAISFLTPAHSALLIERSAITPALIRARGYRTLDHPTEVLSLGFTKAQSRLVPVLAVPLWNVFGEQPLCQIRPDAPRTVRQDGKERPAKYEFPPKAIVPLDVHPACRAALGDPSIPLWLTEGTRKADALLSAGAGCVIGFATGVWGWKGRNVHGGKHIILPDWQHVALNDRLVYVAYDSDLATKQGVQDALDGLYTFLRSRGARPARVQWAEAYTARKWGVDDFFASGKTLADLEAMIPPIGLLPERPPRHQNGSTALPAPRTGPEEYYPYGDAYNAAWLIQTHGERLRYCPAWKSWLTWTGTHWQRDTTGLVLRWQRQTIMHLATHLAALGEGQQKALLEHLKGSLNTARLKAAVEQAHTFEGISLDAEAWDTNPWALNVANGTLDLRTGALRPHQPADLLTKCLDIPYEADATCSTWKAFLWRILDRRQDLMDFVQRTVGYTLTGSTREQCLFICYGVTKTGKSTFLALLRSLLGPYGQQADMASFMHRDRQEVRNDLADLAGSRLVCALEAQEGKRLAESLVKQLTGGVDTIKARFLFQEHFIFQPQFKLFLGTNHKPVIKDTDSAIWERVRLVPFDVQIPKAERDKTLEEQLRVELPGILAWAVRGCLEWQRLGELQEPAAVIDATADYRSEMDDIGRFLQDVCFLGTDATGNAYKTQASRLLKAYHGWCGQTSLSAKAFAKQLEDKGYSAKRETSGMFWHGVGLPASQGEDEDKRSM